MIQKYGVDKLIQKAEAGDAQAQYELAELYYQGQEVEENFNESLKWFERAADQGHPEARAELGLMYVLRNWRK
jgi:uncharacterized protein